MKLPFFCRVSTANYAPIKYKFGSSTYQQHFQERKPFATAFVIPYSRHRSNNPQPNMVNSYNYPDGVRQHCLRNFSVPLICFHQFKLKRDSSGRPNQILMFAGASLTSLYTYCKNIVPHLYECAFFFRGHHKPPGTRNVQWRTNCSFLKLTGSERSKFHYSEQKKTHLVYPELESSSLRPTL